MVILINNRFINGSALIQALPSLHASLLGFVIEMSSKKHRPHGGLSSICHRTLLGCPQGFLIRIRSYFVQALLKLLNNPALREALIVTMLSTFAKSIGSQYRVAEKLQHPDQVKFSMGTIVKRESILLGMAAVFTFITQVALSKSKNTYLKFLASVPAVALAEFISRSAAYKNLEKSEDSDNAHKGLTPLRPLNILSEADAFKPMTMIHQLGRIAGVNAQFSARPMQTSWGKVPAKPLSQFYVPNNYPAASPFMVTGLR